MPWFRGAPLPLHTPEGNIERKVFFFDRFFSLLLEHSTLSHRIERIDERISYQKHAAVTVVCEKSFVPKKGAQDVRSVQ